MFFAPTPAVAQVAVGQWRDHFSYNQAHQLAAGSRYVYAAFNHAVGCYDQVDRMVSRLTKIDLLSDAAIAAIGFDESSQSLVIGYANSNIDIIRNGLTHNLSDLKRSSVSGNKAIYSIRFFNSKAYISTGIGILIVDLQRDEIETVCQLGNDGAAIPVYDVAVDNHHIYAATDNGIRFIARDDRFPNIASRWNTLTALAGQPVSLLAIANHRLLALQPTFDPSLRLLHHVEPFGGSAVIASGDIRSVRPSSSAAVVTYRDSIVLLDSALHRSRVVTSLDWADMNANDAILAANGTLWIAHDWAGLLSLSPRGVVESCGPRGNVSDNVYRIAAFNDKTYLCPGGKTSTYANSGFLGNIYTFHDNQWDQLQRGTADTLIDFLSLAINPQDPSQMAVASWGKGIVMVEEGTVTHVYDETNSQGAIVPYLGDGWRHIRTADVAYDKQGTLWAINSLASHGLISRSSEGVWRSFETKSMIGSSEVDRLLCDSITGFLWMTGKANRIFVHDGSSRLAYVDPNNGSRLETNRVNCLVQDRQGDLWLGTDKGIKVIFDAYNAFGNGGNGERSASTCSNIVISNGEFVEYLMAYEDVICIAVDGANRKWVGTANNGLYLLSATGLDELYHFTAANSPLPSNHVVALCVQPLSGEVFVGTDNGTVGYRGTATYGTAAPHDEAHVFPNPVRPDNDGPIAISGLTNNALVHITDIAGHVVYSTQAFGGQAVWQGRTNAGERVASGVYYVFASDSEGGNRSVAKILVLR